MFAADGADGRVIEVRQRRTGELTSADIASLWALFGVSWTEEGDEFTDEDFEHACGGVHFTIESEGVILSHASVVPRELHANGHRLATGYVEAVATLPDHREHRFGTAVMQHAGKHIDQTYELGALGTALHSFYERLGWVTWRGPSSVRSDDGLVPTPGEDGYIMVRLTPKSPPLDLTAPISCDPRSGDVW